MYPFFSTLLFKTNLYLTHETLKPFSRLLHARFYTSTATAIPYSMLRSYQKECIDACLEELNQGCRKQVVSLPVGSGKTVVMSNFIPLIPNPTPKATKVLLLAHRTELLDQAHNQIAKYNPDLVVHVEQGKRTVDIDKADVIVASVPTLGRSNSSKIQNYDPNLFKAILIDEAHHAVASTYLNILNHFGVDEPDSNILVWGCSATVRRHDGLSLSDVFGKITYHKDFMEMIEQKYLSSMRVTTINTHVDLDHVRKSKTDFKLVDLSNAVNTPARNTVIVSSWKKYAHEQGRKSTLVFAVDIAHTVQLCNTFLVAGINASFITSKTPDLTRFQILEDFRKGKIPVLVNCAILTEGTDIPCVDCILLARPTRSNTLFQQMFGRGLRLFPGKEDCLLIDFVDSFKRSGTDGLVTIPTLLGLSTKDAVIDKDILDLEKEVVEQKAKNEQEENNRKEQLENARKEEEESARQWVKEEQDLSRVKIRITEYDSLNEIMAEFYGSTELRNASWNGWVEIGTDKCVLNVLTKGYLILAKDKKDIWSASFRYDNQKYQGKPFAIPLEADNLTSAVRAADTWISNKFGGAFGGGLVMSRYAKFRKHPMTEAQRQTLKRYKIDIGENDMTKGQAMDLLTKLRFGQMKIWKMQIKEALQEKKQNEKKNSAAILARSKDNSISSAV